MHHRALNYTSSKAPFSAPNEAPTARETSVSRAVSNESFGSRSAAIATSKLEGLARDYLLDCDYRMQSPATIATRRVFLERLVWFLQHRQYQVCGTAELRQFLSYLMHGHEEPGGRWGNPRFNKPVLDPIAGG
jgi:hypothetical protein